jgi:thioredoxin reductase (NADPH)
LYPDKRGLLFDREDMVFTQRGLAIIFFCSIGWRNVLYARVDRALLSDKNNIVYVAILGAGPAGLSAALYTARGGFPTIVFTGPELGGTLMQAHNVENWPAREKTSGKHIMDDLRKQAVEFGAVLVPKTITKVDCSAWPYKLWAEDNEELYALSVIVATGGTPKTISVPGVKDYWGKGISICAICDAPFDKGKEVAVIGGGDSGLDKALQLAAFAEKVTIIEKQPALTATMTTQEQVKKNDTIHVITNSEVVQIDGKEDKVSSITLQDRATKKLYELPVESIYFAIGFAPNTAFLRTSLALDEHGYIKTLGKTQQTSVRGVYAAGNVEDSLYQKAGNALGRGIQAGIDCIQFLQDEGLDQTLAHDIEKRLYKPSELIYELPEITSIDELIARVAQHETIVLDFYSPSCSVCKGMAPLITEVAYKYRDKVPVYKINVQESSDIAKRYAIMAVPTLVLIKNKHNVAQLRGRKSLAELEAMFQV